MRHTVYSCEVCGENPAYCQPDGVYLCDDCIYRKERDDYEKAEYERRYYEDLQRERILEPVARDLHHKGKMNGLFLDMKHYEVKWYHRLLLFFVRGKWLHDYDRKEGITSSVYYKTWRNKIFVLKSKTKEE